MVVVLQINCATQPTARTDTNGNAAITASGTGNTYYLSITLNTATLDNWSVQVGTSGGSTYTFTKGTGGGGHKG